LGAIIQIEWGAVLAGQRGKVTAGDAQARIGDVGGIREEGSRSIAEILRAVIINPTPTPPQSFPVHGERKIERNGSIL